MTAQSNADWRYRLAMYVIALVVLGVAICVSAVVVNDILMYFVGLPFLVLAAILTAVRERFTHPVPVELEDL